MTADTKSKHSLTGREAADLLGVSYRHVQRLTANKTIPSFLVGNARRFPAEAIEAMRSGQPDNGPDEIDRYVEKLVEAAPELSQSQKDRLASIFAASA